MDAAALQHMLDEVFDQALCRGPVRAVGVDFHEGRIETSAQRLTPLFSDLRVSEVPTGYAPFTTG
ncbi:hypothetical protein AB0478_24605 [Streptomyces sp. NPDC051917]|uniref:YxiG-like protein n=1 Tax=Streptomyces sp. NPDC051917 TaxID=3154754 RepID=UPI00344FD6B7